MTKYIETKAIGRKKRQLNELSKGTLIMERTVEICKSQKMIVTISTYLLEIRGNLICEEKCWNMWNNYEGV